MFKGGGIPIGRLFGISLRLHYSWFFIFALVTWALAASYFPDVYPDWSVVASVVAGIVTSLMFFASVMAHELMHSIVATRSGIPVQSITLYIFGGVSQITEEPNKPGLEFKIAIAGPLTSVVLGVIFIAVWQLVPSNYEAVMAVSFWLGWINLVLAIFNLLPGFPLDGGRVLRSIIWWRTNDLRKATRWASNAGRGIGFLFIFGGVAMIFYAPGYLFNGLWLAFIGWFLISAATGSYQQMVLQQMLQNHTVREIMVTDCARVRPDIAVDRLVNEHILPSGSHCLVVAEGDKIRGLITLQNIRGIPREQWGEKTAADAMVALDKLQWVKPEDDLYSVMKKITEQNINQLPVVVDGNIVGMVGRDNLLSFINVRDKLGV
jgi:Zn-dependent protease